MELTKKKIGSYIFIVILIILALMMIYYLEKLIYLGLQQIFWYSFIYIPVIIKIKKDNYIA